MGCWAVGSFGNDSAADWLVDLVHTSDLSLAREAITRVLEESGYLDSPDATEALAAVEVVAASLGRPTEDASAEAELLEWIARVRPLPDPSLVANARQAIDRILAPDSELRELWEETEDFDEWKHQVEALRTNLQT